MTCATINLDSHLIALIATLLDGTGRQLLKIAHQRRFVGCLHQFFGSADNTLGTHISLQTTFLATAAETTTLNNTGMTYLASKALEALVLMAC